MFKHTIILTLFIFVLVPARAKIYGQSSNTENKNQVSRRDGVDGFELRKVIDSVLKSFSLSIDSVRMVFDSIDEPVFRSHFRNNIRSAIASMYIDHVSGYKRILFKSPDYEGGISYVTATGKIVFYDNLRKTQTFFVNKTSEYKGGYLDYLSNDESKSFWDSTAKPVLVTLGAIAVIALFFLVRG